MVRRWRMAKRALSSCVKIQFFQSGKPAEHEIYRTTVAKPRNRDYTFVDLLKGEHHLSSAYSRIPAPSVPVCS